MEQERQIEMQKKLEEMIAAAKEKGEDVEEEDMRQKLFKQ